MPLSAARPTIRTDVHLLDASIASCNSYIASFRIVSTILSQRLARSERLMRSGLCVARTHVTYASKPMGSRSCASEPIKSRWVHCCYKLPRWTKDAMKRAGGCEATSTAPWSQEHIACKGAIFNAPVVALEVQSSLTLANERSTGLSC